MEINILDAEDRMVEQAQALDHAVVEVDVADHGRAVRGIEGLAGPGRDVGPRRGVARFRGNVWRNCLGRLRCAGERRTRRIAGERETRRIAGERETGGSPGMRRRSRGCGW